METRVSPEIEIDSLPISPRRSLRVGDTFRVKRSSGPYSRLTRTVAKSPAGEYRAVRLYRQGGTARKPRIFCEAIEERSGRMHTLYVSGPSFKSRNQVAVIVRPYELSLVSPQQERRHACAR